MMHKTRLALVALGIMVLQLAVAAPAGATTRIRFSDFFVGETYQAGIGMKPDLRLSPRIQGLHGQTVEILGFMDGILPRDGMYFMLLKEPSFLCPFHTISFDWSGFVAIFLKRSTNYIDGPIKITGRLDVGRKQDEMGLESYVRIYDATITKAE